MKTLYRILIIAAIVAVSMTANAQCGCYKEYVAVLNQTGQNAPDATVLKNNTGMTIQWQYDSVGNYYATGFESADPNRVVVIGGDAQNHLILVGTSWNGENVNITVAACNLMFDPIPGDDLLQYYPVTVRIYQ